MTVDLRAIRDTLAAATPGPWYSGVELSGSPGNYWAEEDVYALTADPFAVDFSDIAADEAGELVDGGDVVAADRWEDWSYANETGTVAATHNHISIPDEQHDANNRLIAHAPVWLAELCDELEALRAGIAEHARLMQTITDLQNSDTPK